MVVFLMPVNLTFPFNILKINNQKEVLFWNNLLKIVVLVWNLLKKKFKKSSNRTLLMLIKNLKKLISSLKSKKNFHLSKAKHLKICSIKPGKLKDSQKMLQLIRRKNQQNKSQSKKKKEPKLLSKKYSTLKTFLNLLVDKWSLL